MRAWTAAQREARSRAVRAPAAAKKAGAPVPASAREQRNPDAYDPALAGVEMPGWAPEALHDEFWAVAEREGEEAASHVRRLKRQREAARP